MCIHVTNWWIAAIASGITRCHGDGVMRKKPTFPLLALTALPLALTGISDAATLMWSDGYNTSANSLDSRFERSSAFTRQYFNPASGIPSTTVTAGIGVLTPAYTPSQPTDYHDQILGAPGNGYLQLTGDNYAAVAPNSNGIATLSPFYNFDGFTTGGEVLGKQISFTLDMFTNTPGSNSYSHAAFTVGSLSSNGLNGRAESGTAAAGFSVRFVEDQFGATPNGNFIQFYDGATLVANLLANPAGAGSMTVVLNIDDTTDGNPWDGIGATTIDVSVNSTAVGSFTKGGGGYTDNLMTMEGSTNFVGFGTAEHQFDNLQVFSAPIPEPTTAILGGLGLLAVLRRRRN